MSATKQTDTTFNLDAEVHTLARRAGRLASSLGNYGPGGIDGWMPALEILKMARAEQRHIEDLRRRGTFRERLQQLVLDEATAVLGRRVGHISRVALGVFMVHVLIGYPLTKRDLALAFPQDGGSGATGPLEDEDLATVTDGFGFHFEWPEE